MSRLMDICSLVDYNKETRQHDRKKSIYGSIIVDEQSNYFEGIARTYDEKNAYVVYGTFSEEDGLQMYASNEELESPIELISRANMKSQHTVGKNLLSYAEFNESSIKVIIQDGEIIRDVQPGEVSVLQTQVDIFKERCNLVVENKQKKLK